MVLDVPPSRVPLAGPSAHATLAVASIVVVAVVGIGFLTREPSGPAPEASPPEAIAAASETVSPTPTRPRPARASRTPSCMPPEVAPLEQPIARHPRPLEPTGFETMTPWTGSEVALVADQRSGFWAFDRGRLTRLDSGGRMTASWTFADDEMFGSLSIVAARTGGVWLFGGSNIAWFDGDRLRDTITVPGATSAFQVVDVAEAIDTSVWAVTRRYFPFDGQPASSESKVLRWDGASWTDVCGRPTRADISHIAIDLDGGVWVSPANAAFDVAYFDGRTWTIPPTDAAFDSAMDWSSAWASGLVAADDGTVWLAFGGIERFAGLSWTGMRPEGVDLSGTVSLAAAPDGGIWAATGSTKAARRWE